MPIKQQIFRFKPKDREPMIIWLIIMGFLLFLSIARAATWPILICGSLALVCAAYLARSFYDKIILTDTKISVTHYFRAKEIAWSDISSLEPKWTGFLLSNSGRDMKVFISAELMNLWKFIRVVDGRRPELVQSTKTVFHENPFIAWLIGLAGGFIVYYSAVQILASSVYLVQKTIILLIGLGFVLLAVFTLKRFSLESDRLVVRTLGRERIVGWEDLHVHSSPVYNFSLFITSAEHYSVSVNHLLEGMPSFMLALQAWLRAHRSDAPEASEAVPDEELG